MGFNINEKPVNKNNSLSSSNDPTTWSDAD